ncbi:MAG TPA: DNA repair protein RadA, partial [Anaerolineales bacterium]|nr:DNA repair protein RadA [Anaerolineales bacterium]
MSKNRSEYVCQQCGRRFARMMGRCPNCNAWNSLVEEMVTPAVAAAVRPLGGGRSTPRRLSEIDGDVDQRMPVSISEFGRVLGGGVVPGSVVLIGGDPGIGKSTLLLQVALEIASRQKVLYVSGEESERQIKMRALRLLRSTEADAPEPALPDQLYLVTETNLGVIEGHLQQVRPDLLIVDSIQTTYLDDMDSSAGSVSQVRECASRLREIAKSSSMAVFLIGHVTKEGAIAGPRVLEHIVDTVLYLEGDRFQSYRLLRSVKNRYGATSEVGVFEMEERGMVEVTNPSEAFLAERMINAPGSAIAVTMEGT